MLEYSVGPPLEATCHKPTDLFVVGVCFRAFLQVLGLQVLGLHAFRSNALLLLMQNLEAGGNVSLPFAQLGLLLGVRDGRLRIRLAGPPERLKLGFCLGRGRPAGISAASDQDNFHDHQTGERSEFRP